jgi:hypothetical protein
MDSAEEGGDRKRTETESSVLASNEGGVRKAIDVGDESQGGRSRQAKFLAQ